MLRLRLLLSVVVWIALSLTPVLATIAYSAPLTITETNGAAYDMLPAGVSSNNEWMADNGFMLPSANDTAVETASGTPKPHLVTDNTTWTAVPVGANSQVNLQFTTGNTPSAIPFKIITGQGGYITTGDNATLEGSANFSISASAYVGNAGNISRRTY